MLELKEATTTLGHRRFEFSLQVASTETVVIIGESGAGKSTLLNMISGFTSIESGEVLWHGESLVPMAVPERPVTMLFQKHNLFEHLSVADNIGLGLDPGLRLDDNNNEGRQKIIDSLQQMGLEGFAQRMPGELSGGEQQRVALARALIMDRPLLLLDEPFSALDRETRQSVLELTKKLSTEKQLCTLVVTHNPEDAQVLGARVITIQNDSIKT